MDAVVLFDNSRWSICSQTAVEFEGRARWVQSVRSCVLGSGSLAQGGSGVLSSLGPPHPASPNTALTKGGITFRSELAFWLTA